MKIEHNKEYIQKAIDNLERIEKRWQNAEIEQNIRIDMDDDIANSISWGKEALETVLELPRVLQNLKNMKSAWEDKNFKDRDYAEAHIKSLRTAIEQIEQLMR